MHYLLDAVVIMKQDFYSYKLFMYMKYILILFPYVFRRNKFKC